MRSICRITKVENQVAEPTTSAAKNLQRLSRDLVESLKDGADSSGPVGTPARWKLSWISSIPTRKTESTNIKKVSCQVVFRLMKKTECGQPWRREIAAERNERRLVPCMCSTFQVKPLKFQNGAHYGFLPFPSY